jgi:hypothetical protein
MTTFIYAEDGGFMLEERLDYCKVFRWFPTLELAEKAQPTETSSFLNQREEPKFFTGARNTLLIMAPIWIYAIWRLTR